MASHDNHTPFLTIHSTDHQPDDDIDTEDEEEEEEEEDDDDDAEFNDNDNDAIHEQDVPDDDDLNSHPTTNSVTVAVPPPPPHPSISMIHDHQPVRDDIPHPPPPSQPADDQTRKLFQRLWTDDDEIGLLQGFLNYSTQRGTSQNNPHDTALFYDQIKSKLQLDFNKSQLVEKLRRLKKKYRNVLARISSGKEVSFKTPHDQVTFEIATQIWGTAHSSTSKDHQNIQQQQQQQLLRRIDVDDDMPPNFNPATTNLNLNFASNYNSSRGYNSIHHTDKVVDERESQHKPTKRIRIKMDETNRVLMDKMGGAVPASSSHAQIPNWPPQPVTTVEESLKKRMSSPLLYESFGGRVFGDGIVSPVPLSFASPINMMFGGMEVVDDKWRKQQILELEVYSKRLELVQEHIKLTLEQLRSMGSR